MWSRSRLAFAILAIIVTLVIGTAVAYFVKAVMGAVSGAVAWAVLPIIWDSIKQLLSMLVNGF